MLSTNLSTGNPHVTRMYVVLIHFGAADTTDRAIASLQAGTLQPQKIVVIDHADAPYGLAGAIRPHENSGYGGGATLGLGSLLGTSITGSDLVIVMNNDCVVGTETLRKVQERWSKINQPTLVSTQTGAVNLMTGRAKLNEHAPSPRLSLPYLDGAFLVASYDTWLLLKGMPDRYFLYWEDVALSWQALARGMSLVAWPDLGVTHQASPSENPDKLYYLVRNGAAVLETLTPRPWRIYWWLRNRLRYLYHRDPVLKAALADAIYKRSGKRNV